MSLVIHRILVLCEGNHCRSPLAEALLRQELGPDREVRSAGIHALTGQPVHEETQRQGQILGLDLSLHRGRQLTPDLALRADLILAMDRAQLEACERLLPIARGRAFLLGHWLPPAEQEVADPIHRDSGAYLQAQEHIRRAIAAWLPRLLPNTPRNP